MSISSPFAQEAGGGNLGAAAFTQEQAKNFGSLVLDGPHEIVTMIVSDICKWQLHMIQPEYAKTSLN